MKGALIERAAPKDGPGFRNPILAPDLYHAGETCATKERDMNHLVKLVQDEDGPIHDEDRCWCLIHNQGGSPATLCSGQVYGDGEGNARGVEKRVKRGGLTCEDCIAAIEQIKAYRL